MRDIFLLLDRNEDLDSIKKDFADTISKVSLFDIASIEKEMTNSGIQPEKIQQLCFTHLSVSKQNIGKQEPVLQRGYPICILIEEHKILFDFINEAQSICNSDIVSEDGKARLIVISKYYSDSESHYIREENVQFPYLEIRGIAHIPAGTYTCRDVDGK